MIILDYKDRRSIYEQVVEKFSELIIKGVLAPDSQLPSVRNLAIELSINPNTIQKAYTELEHRGLVYVVKGKGNFVSSREDFILEKRKEVMENLDRVITQAVDVGIGEKELVEFISERYGRTKE